jgi:hypothetical protein
MRGSAEDRSDLDDPEEGPNLEDRVRRRDDRQADDDGGGAADEDLRIASDRRHDSTERQEATDQPRGLETSRLWFRTCDHQAVTRQGDGGSRQVPDQGAEPRS